MLYFCLSSPALPPLLHCRTSGSALMSAPSSRISAKEQRERQEQKLLKTPSRRHTVLTLPSLAWSRALDKSSSRARRSPTPKPSPSRRKRPLRSWGCRASELWFPFLPMQLLAHHFSRRCVNSPDSLSWRMAMVRFFISGDPGGTQTSFFKTRNIRLLVSASPAASLRKFRCLDGVRVRTRSPW